MSDIVLDNVVKRYPDGFEAVKDLNLEIADGEFMILVGPSGCGKSTALNMIAGLEDISAGELRIGGKVVNHVAPRDRDIAMVFQSYALYPHMTVRENMAFALRLAKAAEGRDRPQGAGRRRHPRPHRAPRAQARQPVRRPAPARGDGPRDRPRPQRVPDGRAALEPRRQAARADARTGGAHPAQARPTTVYVTHDQTEAMTLGDRVAVMLSGVLQQVGPPMELYDNPANLFVAGFIGSPGMNFMPATLNNGSVNLPMAEVPSRRNARAARAPARRRRVIAGIRPEDFEDATKVDSESPRPRDHLQR